MGRNIPSRAPDVSRSTALIEQRRFTIRVPRTAPRKDVSACRVPTSPSAHSLLDERGRHMIEGQQRLVA